VGHCLIPGGSWKEEGGPRRMSRQGSFWTLLARQKQPSEEAPPQRSPKGFSVGSPRWVWEAATRIVFPRIHQQKNGFWGCQRTGGVPAEFSPKSEHSTLCRRKGCPRMEGWRPELDIPGSSLPWEGEAFSGQEGVTFPFFSRTTQESCVS
jgi:hypothetical protein